MEHRQTHLKPEDLVPRTEYEALRAKYDALLRQHEGLKTLYGLLRTQKTIADFDE